ncbi:MAG TPA: hypothetical protein VFM90_12895 [Cyclobacteriaceae bacterium]|nr:hypothetical protein [Cyclobacteriaceae bacterium]
MATVEQLRNSVIDKLMTISDRKYLETLHDLITKNSSQNKIFTLSKTQTEILNMSEADIEQGRFLSQEQLDNEDTAWLNQQ